MSLWGFELQLGWREVAAITLALVIILDVAVLDIPPVAFRGPCDAEFGAHDWQSLRPEHYLRRALLVSVMRTLTPANKTACSPELTLTCTAHRWCEWACLREIRCVRISPAAEGPGHLYSQPSVDF